MFISPNLTRMAQAGW